METCEGKTSLVNGESNGGQYPLPPAHQKLQNGNGSTASPLHTPPLTPSAR